MKKFFPQLLILLIVPFLFSCPGTPTETTLSRRDDLERLKQRLPRLHANLFRQLSAARWENALEQLQNEGEEIPREQFLVELMRLLAMSGEPHTQVKLQNLHRFPLVVEEFETGLYVTAIDEQYELLTGSRLVAVEDTPVEEVMTQLGALIGFPNPSCLRERYPRLLTIPEILAGLNLTDSLDEARFIFENDKGRRTQATLTAGPYTPPGTAPPGTISYTDAIRDNIRTEIALYWREPQKKYWSRDIQGTNAFYVRCRGGDSAEARNELEEMNQALEAAVSENLYRRYIVDMREAGDSAPALPEKTLRLLKKAPGLMILIGRKTSGFGLRDAAALQADSDALLVGEPTGGTPDFFTDIQELVLPFTGFVINYPARYNESEELQGDALYPDIYAFPRWRDHYFFRDSVLQKALTIRPAE